MKTKSKILKSAVASLLLTSGCAKAPNSENTVTASFKMTGSAASANVASFKPKSLWSMFLPRALALAPPAMVDSTGVTVNLTEAWVVVKKIEFKSEESASTSEDSEIEVEFEGPYVVDLLSNTPLTLDTQAISERAIRRIKMKFHEMTSLPSGAPTQLQGYSMYVVGTAGGNSFTFQSKDSTEVQIGGPSSFQPGEGSSLLIEVQIANIFKQINMSTVVAGEAISDTNRHSGANLCPSIDSSANDIYTCIRKGLEVHANFGRDKDGDNHLSSSDDKVK